MSTPKPKVHSVLDRDSSVPNTHRAVLRALYKAWGTKTCKEKIAKLSEVHEGVQTSAPEEIALYALEQYFLEQHLGLLCPE